MRTFTLSIILVISCCIINNANGEKKYKVREYENGKDNKRNNDQNIKYPDSKSNKYKNKKSKYNNDEDASIEDIKYVEKIKNKKLDKEGSGKKYAENERFSKSGKKAKYEEIKETEQCTKKNCGKNKYLQENNELKYSKKPNKNKRNVDISEENDTPEKQVKRKQIIKRKVQEEESNSEEDEPKLTIYKKGKSADSSKIKKGIKRENEDSVEKVGQTNKNKHIKQYPKKKKTLTVEIETEEDEDDTEESDETEEDNSTEEVEDSNLDNNEETKEIQEVSTKSSKSTKKNNKNKPNRSQESKEDEENNSEEDSGGPSRKQMKYSKKFAHEKAAKKKNLLNNESDSIMRLHKKGGVNHNGNKGYNRKNQRDKFNSDEDDSEEDFPKRVHFLHDEDED